MDKLLRILWEINPDIDYEKEESLVDDGIFDSLEIMSIVSEIEDCFHIDIAPEDVIAENFNSAKNMMKMIEKYYKPNDGGDAHGSSSH